MNTTDVNMVRVSRDGLLLRHIKPQDQTPELCFAAIQQNGLALQYVYSPTREMCYLAVQQTGFALRFIVLINAHPTLRAALDLAEAGLSPFEKELAFIAIRQNGDVIRDLPEDCLTQELNCAAVCEYGLALRYIPETLITEYICLKAVEQNGLALQYVPNEFITHELCCAALTQDKNAWPWVPPTLQQTPELRRLAYIPEQSRFIVRNGVVYKFNEETQCEGECLGVVKSMAS